MRIHRAIEEQARGVKGVSEKEKRGREGATIRTEWRDEGATSPAGSLRVLTAEESTSWKEELKCSTGRASANKNIS